MRLSLITATAVSALLLCHGGAMAETMQPNQSANQATQNKGMRAQVRDMLQKAGFTDVHVMTGSLLIRAKDKDGNPVVMNLSPDSVTEVTEVGASGSDDSDNTKGSTANSFVSIPSSDELSSNIVGLDVYNYQNSDIGKIKDIAMNQHGRAQAYIVSVGGFLGMGDHYVAVNPSEIKISYNDSEKKWHATMNATADQLKAAPEFKYSGRWNASKS